MRRHFDDRDHWIARHVLPEERVLRAAIARWRLPDGLEADDIVQEVFGRIAEMDDPSVIENVRGYMIGIARNLVLAQHRRSRIVSIRAIDDLDQLDPASDEAWVDEQVSDRQQLHILAMAVAALEDPGRSIFLLRLGEELTQREIAERMGLSEDRVQRSLVATLRDLAALLGRGGKAKGRASRGLNDTQADADDGRARDERGD